MPILLLFANDHYSRQKNIPSPNPDDTSPLNHWQDYAQELSGNLNVPAPQTNISNSYRLLLYEQIFTPIHQFSDFSFHALGELLG